MPLGYARWQLSEPTSAPTRLDADATVGSAIDDTRLAPPNTWALVHWLNRVGAARYRYRLLQGVALSLAINQCSLLWLGEVAGAHAAGQARLMASTLYWTMGLALVAGWVLLGGWFDAPTRALIGQLALRRGYAAFACRQLETTASWRWLALLLAFPCVVLAVVAAVRVPTLSELWALGVNLALCLLFAQLAAASVVVAVVAMRRLELGVARRIWLLTCILPELIRPLLPGFPTLRSVVSALSQVIVRWGAIG